MKQLPEPGPNFSNITRTGFSGLKIRKLGNPKNPCVIKIPRIPDCRARKNTENLGLVRIRTLVINVIRFSKEKDIIEIDSTKWAKEKPFLVWNENKEKEWRRKESKDGKNQLPIWNIISPGLLTQNTLLTINKSTAQIIRRQSKIGKSRNNKLIYILIIFLKKRFGKIGECKKSNDGRLY